MSWDSSPLDNALFEDLGVILLTKTDENYKIIESDSVWDGYATESAGPGLTKVKYEHELSKKHSGHNRRSVNRSYPESIKASKKRKTNWREEEKTILAGLTMNYFGIKHSLKESRAEGQYSKDADSKVSLAWQRIYKQYEKARIRWNKLMNDDLIQRTENALSKKWKDSGLKSSAGLEISEEDKLPETTQRLMQFLTHYNKDFILTCNEERFDLLVLQRQNQDVYTATKYRDNLESKN